MSTPPHNAAAGAADIDMFFAPPPAVATTAPALVPVIPPPPVAANVTAVMTALEGQHITAPADAAGPPAGCPELDLAFCCDCTGSMGAYIRSAQDNIIAISQAIHDRKGGVRSVKYGLVQYRDHPPQDTSFITVAYPFTKNLDVMKANVDTMFAQGGGDGPEAVAAGLKEVLELNWRPNSTKVCVFIADAPPHGLGESGDGFPDGCPQGNDPVAILRAMAEKGITVYAIGVEPVLSTNYKFARDFMIMAAKVTDGKFLPLGKASILANVIVSTAIEGMELEKFWADIEHDVKAQAAAANELLTTEDLCARVEAVMKVKAAEMKTEQISVQAAYQDDDVDYDRHNCDMFLNATSLNDARSKLDSNRNAHVAQKVQGYSWASQEAVMSSAPMSVQQQSRAYGHNMKKAGIWSK